MRKTSCQFNLPIAGLFTRYLSTLLSLKSTFCSFLPNKATQNHIKALVLQLILFLTASCCVGLRK